MSKLQTTEGGIRVLQQGAGPRHGRQIAELLLVGAVLGTGQCTVDAVRRVMVAMPSAAASATTRRSAEVWSFRRVARVLLLLLLQHLDRGNGSLVFGIDETLERRRGAKIREGSIYRDVFRSSRHQLVEAIGLRWVSLVCLGLVPWTWTSFSTGSRCLASRVRATGRP